MFEFRGKSLVGGSTLSSGRNENRDENEEQSHFPLLYSTVGISFWGGIDPLTGRVTDQTHPLFGRKIGGKILAIPSGRGSCTGSQVLLELLLNNEHVDGIAPKAIILRDSDPVIATGAIIYEEFFYRTKSIPIVSVGPEAFKKLREATSAQVHGNIVTGFESVTDFERSKEGLMKTSVESLISVDESIQNSTLSLSEEEMDLIAFANNDNINSKNLFENVSKAYCKALRVIARVAVACESERLIDIKQAHIDGVTYIGDGGRRFVNELVKLEGKVSVPTTLNSGSVDRRRWESLGLSRDESGPALEVGNAYLKLGCKNSFTCAPYLLYDTKPKLSEDIAWGESNAVVFANSVIGARTAKYPDYLDICAAICGKVPQADVHITSNRLATVEIDASDIIGEILLELSEPCYDSFFPAFGYLCGSKAGSRIPVISGLDDLSDKISRDDLKAFSAAFGTTSGAPLFHIVGVTPEATTLSDVLCNRRDKETIKLTADDILKALETLDRGLDREDYIDIVALGNPHLSLDECKRIASLCDGDESHSEVKVIATMGRQIYEEAKAAGYICKMKKFGFSFINDTCWCMIQKPVVPRDVRQIMTNSGKYAHYAPSLVGHHVGIRFGCIQDCLTAARTGRSPKAMPQWITKLNKMNRYFSTGPRRFAIPWASIIKITLNLEERTFK